MRFVFALLLLIAATYPSPALATAAAGPGYVSAPEAIVIDALTGRVLYNRHADTERYPASTMKIMTALVVLRSHLPMNRYVTVNATAVAYRGSTAGLWLGERIRVKDLLHGMLMPSGNDAAAELAEADAGTVPRFVDRMNAEARALGLWHTHYLGPNGFDIPGQYTTARDLAKLARIALRMPVFARIVRTRSWTVRGAGGRVLHHWYNLNQLLWRSPAVDGVKTGTTPGAGACLVSSERSNGRWVIEVNMGSTEATRFSDGMALLDYGLSVSSRSLLAR